MPTGLLDVGEDIGAGAEREVRLLSLSFTPSIPPSSNFSVLPTFDPPPSLLKASFSVI